MRRLIAISLLSAIAINGCLVGASAESSPTPVVTPNIADRVATSEAAMQDVPPTVRAVTSSFTEQRRIADDFHLAVQDSGVVEAIEEQDAAALEPAFEEFEAAVASYFAEREELLAIWPDMTSDNKAPYVEAVQKVVEAAREAIIAGETILPELIELINDYLGVIAS